MTLGFLLVRAIFVPIPGAHGRVQSNGLLQGLGLDIVVKPDWESPRRAPQGFWTVSAIRKGVGTLLNISLQYWVVHGGDIAVKLSRFC